MAGKIPEETKDAIILAYKQGGKSKAQLAREYEVSVSSITRIVAVSSVAPKEPGAGTAKSPSRQQGQHDTESGNHQMIDSSSLQNLQNQLQNALSSHGDETGHQDMDSLVQEFISWISRRDKGEKELISLEMAIESLRLEKSSVENEISRLGSKAGSLEILIGRMKKLAEDSQLDLSLVEERLANIEEKLSIDHDILLIGSAIRLILRGEEPDDELVSMIAEISRINSRDAYEKKEAVRKALMEYSDFFIRRMGTS